MTVLHYVEHWLELSSGFVHAHVSRSRHRAVVVSHNATENRDAFPHRPVIRLDRLAAITPEHRWRNTRTNVLRVIAAASHARIVHVHFGYAVRDVRGLVERSKLPLVVSLHGSDVTALPRRDPQHYDVVPDLAAAVIVPSRYLADAAVDLGFDRSRIHVIPAGVDTTLFTPSAVPADPVVAFVGRFVEKKGLDVLLAAWPQVLAQVPTAQLHLLGSGPLAALLPEGDTHIRHLPPQPHRRAAQVRDLIRSARVVVSPSRTAADGDAESLLLVNLEAQASGRPVVTTRHGGIPEFVAEGESALVVGEADADALAAALVDVLTDESLAARLGAAGPAVARRFDVADCAARVDGLYDTLIRSR